MEGAQLVADACELLLESMDRGDQVSRSVTWAEAAESLIERKDDELQAVTAMPQPRLAQVLSKRSAAARHIRASCRRDWSDVGAEGVGHELESPSSVA
jgi:hypothetical protein